MVGTAQARLRPPYEFIRLFQHDPRRRMIAGAFFAADGLVDTGLEQARGEGRAEQEMIEPQARIARPAISLVVPEGVDPLIPVQLADRIAPALCDQRGKGGTALRLDQCILV